MKSLLASYADSKIYTLEQVSIRVFLEVDGWLVWKRQKTGGHPRTVMVDYNLDGHAERTRHDLEQDPGPRLRNPMGRVMN